MRSCLSRLAHVRHLEEPETRVRAEQKSEAWNHEVAVGEACEYAVLPVTWLKRRAAPGGAGGVGP